MIKREENKEEKLRILLKLPPPLKNITNETIEEEIINLFKNGNTILDDLHKNKEFNNSEHLNVKYKLK